MSDLLVLIFFGGWEWGMVYKLMSVATSTCFPVHPSSWINPGFYYHLEKRAILQIVW